ncbi:MAG: alpha-amylase family glycosyl hydrolase [Puniceicoccaceae bacterium]
MPFFMEPDSIRFEIERVHPYEIARLSGYCIEGDQIRFVLDPTVHPSLDVDESVYVAGQFNDWQAAIGKQAYRLCPYEMNGNPVLVVDVPVSELKGEYTSYFRFVSEKHRWLSVPENAPNLVPNRYQGSDFMLNLRQSGRHVFHLRTDESISLHRHIALHWKDPNFHESIAISNAEFYLSLESSLPMGVSREGELLVFRLFAPRANRVTLELFKSLKQEKRERHEMKENKDGSWEIALPRDWDRHYYYYYVDGINHDGSTCFDGTLPIVDPYARAMASSKGPGIIVDPSTQPLANSTYHPPMWHDLVIAEVHLRDLMANSFLPLSNTERQQFRGMSKWLRDQGNYLRQLGVNAIEFQPLHEFEYDSKDEYHWGYMPVNWFSPASCNARFPKNGSQIEGFRDMVAATHEAGFAFILDVVYNHLGSPNALYAIDKHYYYEVDSNFNLTNWSGVGNDLRCRSPMAKRLIIDSLKYYMTHMGVDGFRFDLGELIGRSVLEEIEHELKAINPSVILIAEPWSFRGHIADKLKFTGFASWNDSYRDFFVKYLGGDGSPEQFAWHLKGSPEGLTRFPAQTVNYSESHDDYCWMDLITENGQRDGSHPSFNDMRRTHLMFSMLFISLGIPMISAGQDFLRSKRGVRNTYQRGDINAMDYSRLISFSNTHDYVRRWIAFRLSDAGSLLRLEFHPDEDYFRFSHAEHGGRGLAVLINANHQHGERQLIYAINPSLHAESCSIEGMGIEGATQIADQFRFEIHGLPSARLRWKDGKLLLPPLTCGLWIR